MLPPALLKALITGEIGTVVLILILSMLYIKLHWLISVIVLPLLNIFFSVWLPAATSIGSATYSADLEVQG